MPFTCHDCRLEFENDPSCFADVEVGKSTTWMNVGTQAGSAVTRHYQKFPVCRRCFKAREDETTNIVLIVAACLCGAIAVAFMFGIFGLSPDSRGLLPLLLTGFFLFAASSIGSAVWYFRRRTRASDPS